MDYVSIEIPATSNPYEVWVNGVKYTYEAGKTAEVPGEVAIVIQQHIKVLEEGLLPPEKGHSEGGSGGGVSSWNDLTDKPFGYGKHFLVDGDCVFGFEEGMAGFGIEPDQVMADTIENGGTVYVTFDGVSYQYDVPDMVTAGGVHYIGDLTMLGGTGNGEPFAGMLALDTVVIFDLAATETVTHNLKIATYGTKRLTRDVMPNAIYLYTGVENHYLHKINMADENRITKEELKAYVDTGVQIRVVIGVGDGFFELPVAIDVYAYEYGEITTYTGGKYRTAEYTGS